MAVVGIDLGTTNTVVGVVGDGQATTLQDDEGFSLVPSVVSFHPNGSVLVGRTARDRRLVDPKSTIYSIKRLIGRSWNSEEVTQARKRFPFEMREGPGQAALVVARGETFTLPEISAFVLRHAKAIAEKRLGETVDRAVITVPANFNDLQRAATKVAGRVAGLEVLRILNEPTAAALAYGYGRRSSERIAIYDFGGGTFDVTLLDLSGNVFEVLATAGDTFLGGDDIDAAIVQRMADACLREHRFDPHGDAQAMERLRVAAERLKVALSSQSAHTERLDALAHGAGGRELSVSYTMTRTEFDELAAPLIARTFRVCEEALSIARTSAGDFDQVILVGGSTRIPLVRERVAEYFQREALDRVSPDEVVAIGASIQASALTGAERRRSVLPRPPMPAARKAESQAGRNPAARSRSAPPPLPPRKTDPFGRVRSRGPMKTELGLSPAAKREEKRRTTGVGLGPPPRGGPPLSSPPVPAKSSGASPPDESPPRRELDSLDEELFPPPELPGRGPGTSTRIQTTPERAQSRDITAGVEVDLEAETGLGWQPPAASASSQPAPMFPPAAEPRQPTPAPLGPVQPEVHQLPQTTPQPERPPVPLLVDVTPLSLCVETVGGYRDVIIRRNSPVPCEQARTFVTAQDDQLTVYVRVGQGESGTFRDNTLLGQLELTGLPRAPRGSVRIRVTFGLDTDGILNVSAREESTGRETQARLRLVGMPEERDVARMASRQAAHRVI